MAEENIFSTRDLALAATLVTLKFALLGVDYQQEGTKRRLVGYFKFEETPVLLEARQRFMQGLLQVEPRLFVTNMRSLKADVENAFDNPRSSL